MAVSSYLRGFIDIITKELENRDNTYTSLSYVATSEEDNDEYMCVGSSHGFEVSRASAHIHFGLAIEYIAEHNGIPKEQLELIKDIVLGVLDKDQDDGKKYILMRLPESDGFIHHIVSDALTDKDIDFVCGALSTAQEAE